MGAPAELFATIKALLKRGLTQSEVDRINASLESRVVPDSPDPVFRPFMVGEKGKALIKQFEGCHKDIGGGKFRAYPDPGTGSAPWTIGWGATGPGINSGTVWTKEQCDARFDEDMVAYAHDVQKAINGTPTTQDQFDAMVSFHYNTGAIGRATLTRMHKAGDYAGAAAQFGLWVNANGKRLNGLVRRRKAEADLYRGLA